MEKAHIFLDKKKRFSHNQSSDERESSDEEKSHNQSSDERESSDDVLRTRKESSDHCEGTVVLNKPGCGLTNGKGAYLLRQKIELQPQLFVRRAEVVGRGEVVG